MANNIIQKSEIKSADKVANTKKITKKVKVVNAGRQRENAKVDRDIVLNTLYKKGVGYNTKEIVEEYASDEKGGEMIKRKVTKKRVPPDISALKTYLEYTKVENEFDSMTDTQLEIEKTRLLKLLKAEEENK